MSHPKKNRYICDQNITSFHNPCFIPSKERMTEFLHKENEGLNKEDMK